MKDCYIYQEIGEYFIYLGDLVKALLLVLLVLFGALLPLLRLDHLLLAGAALGEGRLGGDLQLLVVGGQLDDQEVSLGLLLDMQLKYMVALTKR